jgi:hypothetical protein
MLKNNFPISSTYRRFFKTILYTCGYLSNHLVDKFSKAIFKDIITLKIIVD